MALNNQVRSFKDKGRDIKYLNKDFVDFRNNLIEFAKLISQQHTTILTNHHQV